MSKTQQRNVTLTPVLMADYINPYTGVRTASVYQKLFLGPVADGTGNFSELRAFSSNPYRWSCPVHPDEVWVATPTQVSRAKKGLWLVDCEKCAASRYLFATTFPKLAAYAIDDISGQTNHYVYEHRTLWSCPQCARPMHAGLIVVFDHQPATDDPDHLATRCPACTGRTLLSMPALARQFVRHGETGETDPGLIVPGQTAASRNRDTLWCCEHCHQQFHLAVYTAADIYRTTNGEGVLHAACRPEPIAKIRARLRWWSLCSRRAQ